jgi:hypothetical protein
MKYFENDIILYTDVHKTFLIDDINKSIKELKSLFLKLNNGKLNKEQKRSLTSLYNQLIKSLKEL